MKLTNNLAAIGALTASSLAGFSFCSEPGRSSGSDIHSLTLPVNPIDQLKARIAPVVGSDGHPKATSQVGLKDQQDAFDKWKQLSSELKTFDILIMQTAVSKNEVVARQVPNSVKRIIGEMNLTETSKDRIKELRQLIEPIDTQIGEENKSALSKAIQEFDFRDLQKKVHVAVGECRGSAPRLKKLDASDSLTLLTIRLADLKATLPPASKAETKADSGSPKDTLQSAREQTAIDLTVLLDVVFPKMVDGDKRTQFETQNVESWTKTIQELTALIEKAQKMLAEQI